MSKRLFRVFVIFIYLFILICVLKYVRQHKNAKGVQIHIILYSNLFTYNTIENLYVVLSKPN